MEKAKRKYHKSFNWFIIPFILFIIGGGITLLFISKGDIVLLINKYSTPGLDKFFLQLTDIGHGNFVAIVGVLFLFYKIRWSIITFTNLLWVGIFSNLLKRVIFPQTSRPFHYFYYDDFHRFLHDAPLIYYNSFPSGHTMTVFGLCSVLAYLIHNKISSLVFFMMALLVGISRIYLLQHFFQDVFAGALFGVISLFITVWILDYKFNMDKSTVLNKGLLQFLKKRN